jgi:hypothetical protein
MLQAVVVKYPRFGNAERSCVLAGRSCHSRQLDACPIQP